MHPYNIKSGYIDTLAHKRRVRFLFKIIIFLVIVIFAGAGAIYLLFFSKFLDLRSVTLIGLNSLNSEEIKRNVDNRLNDDKIFGYISRKNNILFLNFESIKAELLSSFPILKSAEIEKKFPHGVIFNFQERIAIGAWCFKGGDCRYFDIDGNSWGRAAKSSGFLMASVDDLRKLDDKEIDKEYFEAMKIFFKGFGDLPFISGEIIISENAFRDFSVYSADGYPILFSLDTDITGQLKILDVFLSNKKKEADFTPKYIDLRINGKVYYKEVRKE